MGQTVKLRRSAVSGRVPINSQLQLGELSVNTADGKLFFAKSGSLGPSIEEIITTNTQNTGSIDLVGALTASVVSSSFIGDGSELYNIPASGVVGLSLDQISSDGAVAAITAEQLDINVNTVIDGSLTATEITGSGLGLTNVPVNISGSSHTSTNYNGLFTKIHFDESTGIKVEGDTSTGIAKIYLDGVASESGGGDGSTKFIEVTTPSSTWTFNHGLGEKYPSIMVFDSNNNVIIPQNIEAVSTTQLVVSFASPQIGYVTATVGGGLPTTTASDNKTLVTLSGVPTWKEGILSGSVSFNSFSSSIDTIIGSLETTSGSHDGRLDSLETSTSSLNSFTSSINTTIKSKLNTEGVISGSIQIDHDATTNYVGNEHIDHSSITIGSGKGLSGGGSIDTNRSLTLDTGSVHFLSAIKSKLNTETVVSGSEQINITETTNYNLVDGRLDSIESFTSSIDNTYATDADVTTLRGDLNTYTSSNDTLNSTQDGRLDSLESNSGSYLTEYNDEYTTGATFGTSNGIVTFTRNDGDQYTVDLDGRYLTSFTETDPIFTAHAVYDITSTQIGNWDTAYGWGDHSQEGYLTTYNNEYTTGATFNGSNGIITFTRNDGDTYTLNISSTLTDINVTGGTYNDSTQTLRLNKSNGTSIDVTGFAVDTVLHTTGATFNSSDGVVTFTKNGGDTYTVDLDGRYLTSFTETDPIFTASPSAGITETNITNWDSAYTYSTVGHLPLSGGTITGDVRFLDSDQLRLGTGNDLRLWHNGTNSYVFNYSGGLIVGSRNGDLSLYGSDGSTGEVAYLFLDGSQQNVNFQKDAIFTDNKKVLFGGSGDLQMYHDGTNSYIKENGTGVLNIQGSTVLNIGGTNGEVGIQYTENAGVTLRHNNVVKFTTDSTGVSVTGIINATGGNSSQWNTAYGWGDHGSAGYLTSYNDEYTTGATFNTSNGVITFTRNDGDTFNVDIDNRYLPLNGGTISGTLTISSASDGHLILKQTDAGSVSGTPEGGWNYMQFYDAQNDRQGYFGIDSSGNFLFNPEVSGAEVRMNRTLRVSSNIISTGTITASGYNDGNWNTAYGWGDHSTVGYITGYSEVDTLDSVTNRGAITTNDVTTGKHVISKQTNTTGTSGTTFLEIYNNVGSDISQQQSFIDFKFTDTNANFTPQVRIGAQVGRDADASAMSKEGAGAFVVYTGDGTDELGGGTLTESFRVSYNGNATAQGIITATGGTSTNWNTAYGWGDHSTVGYITGFTNTNEFTTGATFNSGNGVVTFTRNNGGDTFTVDLDGRYLTSFTETDPIFTASPSAGITETNITNWDSAYGWGDHSTEGYLTSYNDEYTTGVTWTAATATLTFTRNDGDTYNVQMLETLTDVTVTGGTYASGTQILTLTKSDGSTVDVSGFAIDTDVNWYTTGATFNTGNGVITGTRSDGGTWTVDIDNRYLQLGGGTLTGNLTLNSTNPEILFNGTSDAGVDMAIKATPEGLDFYEPEDSNKIHFQILDDTGVNAAFGLQIGGTQVLSGGRVLSNVTGNISMFTNDSNYLTSFTETDPIFTASPSAGITDTNISNWNTAYGWGNHASAGYITGYSEVDTLATVTSRGSSTTNDISVGDFLATHQSGDDATTKAEMLSYAVAKFRPHSTNSGTLAIAQVDGGNSVGLQFTNGAGSANWDMSLQPFGGNVGINKINPAGALHVYSGTSERFLVSGDVHVQGATDLNINGTSRRLSFTNGTGTIRTTNATELYLQTNSTTALTIDVNQNVSVVGTLSASNYNNTNWDTAYGWGDHASAGYITGYSEVDTLATVTSRGSSTTTSVRFSNDLNYFGKSTGNNEGEIVINTGIAGSPQIGFTEHGDASWAIGIDDADNSFKIHGTATNTIPEINGLAIPLFEVTTTAGVAYLNNNRIHHAGDFTTTDVANGVTAYGWGDHSLAGYTGDQDLSGYLLNTTDTFAGNLTIIGGNNNSKESFLNVKRGSGAGLWLKFQTDSTSANNVSQFVIRRSTDNVDILSINDGGNLSVPGTLSASGYNDGNWNTAYGWGDHSTEGYVTGNYLPIAGGTLTGDLIVGSITKTSNSVVKVLADQGYKAGFEAYGNGQGTGYIYVGQSTTHGGGMSYNGDSNPALVSGETDDRITFYRRTNSVDSEVFSYNHNSDSVYFNGEILPSTINTGQGSTEVHLMNQNIRTTDSPTFASINTGQGATEVHLMNQNIRTTDDVQFGKGKFSEQVSVNNRTAISVAHWARSSNTTGAIKIKVPGTHTGNWSMFVLRITTYEYNSNAHAIYYVSGHDWTSGWYQNGVTVQGTGKTLSLGFSTGANEDYIILGDVGSTWQYGHVTVDVVVHPEFYSSSMDITEGWSITQETALDGITINSVTNKQLLDTSNYGTKISNWDTAFGWGDHSTEGYATETYVGDQIDLLVDTAPGTLDTLNELAAALGDDPNFATTITNSIATKLPLSGGTLTGDLIIQHTDGAPGELLHLRNDSNGNGATIKFSDQATTAAQHGLLSYYHSDGASYGSGNTFVLDSTEANMSFVVKGKVMYSEGIYTTPATGTGAGTRKDSNWDSAYTWGNHADEGYITSYTNTTYSAGTGIDLNGTTFRLNGGSIPTGVNLNTYRSTGIYSQNSNSQAAAGSNYPVAQAGVLEVWNDDYGNGLFTTQRYKHYSSTADYSRVYYNGSWSSWRNLAQDTDTVYTLPFTDNSSNWNTAYGWGDHASAGYQAGGNYLLDSTDTFTGSLSINGDIRGIGQQLILNAGESYSVATAQTNEYVYVNAEQGLEVNSDTGNWSGGWAARKTALLRGDLLRIDGEDLTKTNIQNFKTAYGWGDHAGAGYLTSLPSHNHDGVYLPIGGKAADSEKLDGVDSTQFLRSDTADSFTGTITMGTQKALVANNYGRGVYGLYSASRYQHVWSMGTSYNLSDDGTTSGNLYGLAFTHTNVGGQSKSGLAHQLLIMDNGVTKSAIGRGIWTDGTITTTSHGTSADWNTAYGWGNHASGGYASSSHTHTASDITSGTFAAARFATSTRYNIGLITGYSSQSRDKLRVWDSSEYSIGMKNGYDYGHIGSGEYAMSFQMSNTAGRGWWWGDTSHTDDQGAASITTEGKMVIAKSLSVGQGETITNPSDTPLYVEGTTAGETVFEVQGTSGQLFSITDSLIGDIFEVSDISGVPIFTVNSSGVVTVDDTLHVKGDVIAYYASDRRLKDNIKPIENSIDKIKMIGGYEFDWNSKSKNNHGHDVGVIAQEIEEVLPELVGTRSDGFKGVKYEKLTALLIQANKELIARVEELESKLKK